MQHVSYYEAGAYAHWAGKRLPTEIEWERAACWHDHEGKFRYPWGQAWMGFEASLDRRRFSPAPAGSYAGGVSPVGCVQMAGDVWEWTSSPFRPYPGFVPFPYPECSEVNFGDDVRVLRGGSWATDGLVARTSFRRWEIPARREIFAGFRCAQRRVADAAICLADRLRAARLERASIASPTGGAAPVERRELAQRDVLHVGRDDEVGEPPVAARPARRCRARSRGRASL